MRNEFLLVLDLGIGNIGSVVRMAAKAGARAVVVRDLDRADDRSKIILPGVGHFDRGMQAIRDAGIYETLSSRECLGNIKVLGICLGMHLLCKSSEEGRSMGLGLIDAEVKKFRWLDNGAKVPHMGWNQVISNGSNPLFVAGEVRQRFYFVHSYKVVPSNPEIIIGTTSYHGEFCSAFMDKNIFGVQFHPEKSHKFGLALMKRFIEL